jgi:hypothetical protein
MDANVSQINADSSNIIEQKQKSAITAVKERRNMFCLEVKNKDWAFTLELKLIFEQYL